MQPEISDNKGEPWLVMGTFGNNRLVVSPHARDGNRTAESGFC